MEELIRWIGPWVVFYAVLFGPGLINDIRLVRNVPYDGLVLSLLFSWSLWSTYAVVLEALELTTLVSIVAGLYLASLERFLVGSAFHSTAKVELWHENYHEELRRRKVTKCYLLSDHLLEIVAYVVLFSFYELIFYFVLGLSAKQQQFLWLGILAEHYFGHKLRLRVQYAERGSWRGSLFERFLNNAEAYYWYHIVVNPQTGFGFSSPWWDSIMGHHPFSSRWSFSSPLPFVDFFFVDFSTEVAAAFEKYKADPASFCKALQNQIIQHHQHKGHAKNL
ncbi:hypothetical protein QOT17_017629 [Balamuthia mandrillaris]